MMDWLEKNCLDVLSLLLSTFTAWIAWKALNTWKDELKFKAIDQLEDAYQKYLETYVHYFYACIKALQNDSRSGDCPCDIDEFQRFIQVELDYRNFWRKIKSHIKQDEYINFNFKPENLQGKLRSLSPYRGDELQADGHYRIIQNENFDKIMFDLLKDGTDAIQRLRK